MVRVSRVDGSVVPGFVLETRDDGLLVRSGDADLFIPWVEIDEVVHVESPVEPSEDTSLEEVPASPQSIRGEGPKALPSKGDAPTASPDRQAYEASRIRLIDKRGRVVGPDRLGYRDRDFGKDAGRRFHATKDGRHLSLPEFVEFSGSTELLEDYERRLDDARGRVAGGFAILGLSASLASVGWPLALGGTATGDPFPLFSGPGFVGWSIATAIIAASVQADAQRRLRKLRKTDLRVLMDRPEAWPHVQSYNSALRKETGVPDHEDADSK